MAPNRISASRIRSYQVFVVDACLTVAGLATLFGGVFSVYNGSAVMTMTCIAAGLILLFAATIHRFEVLKGFGIEAKAKELDATIDKAEIALEQLKTLTQISLKAIISMTSRAGRLTELNSVQESYEAALSVKGILIAQRTEPELIRTIMSPWACTVAGDLMIRALTPYRDACASAIKGLEDELSADPQGKATGSPESLFLKSQIKELHSSIHAIGTARKEWPLEQLSGNIEHLVGKTNGLSEAKKTELLFELRPFTHELRFLSENLCFDNKQLWFSTIRFGD